MMNLKRLLLGPQQEDLLGKSAIQRAAIFAQTQDKQITSIGLLAALLMIAGGIWLLVWHGDLAEVLGFALLFISFFALVSTRAAIAMPFMQMAQTEEQARETAHLVSAIEELTKELRLQRDGQRQSPTSPEHKPPRDASK